jgi:hypothetical protein
MYCTYINYCINSLHVWLLFFFPLARSFTHSFLSRLDIGGLSDFSSAFSSAIAPSLLFLHTIPDRMCASTYCMYCTVQTSWFFTWIHTFSLISLYLCFRFLAFSSYFLPSLPAFSLHFLLSHFQLLHYSIISYYLTARPHLPHLLFTFPLSVPTFRISLLPSAFLSYFPYLFPTFSLSALLFSLTSYFLTFTAYFLPSLLTSSLPIPTFRIPLLLSGFLDLFS